MKIDFTLQAARSLPGGLRSPLEFEVSHLPTETRRLKLRQQGAVQGIAGSCHEPVFENCGLFQGAEILLRNLFCPPGHGPAKCYQVWLDAQPDAHRTFPYSDPQQGRPLPYKKLHMLIPGALVCTSSSKPVQWRNRPASFWAMSRSSASAIANDSACTLYNGFL